MEAFKRDLLVFWLNFHHNFEHRAYLIQTTVCVTNNVYYSTVQTMEDSKHDQ